MGAPVGNQYAVGNNGGRVSPYDLNPDYYQKIIRQFKILGKKDEEVAEFFGIHVNTLHDWKNRFKEFGDAYKIGKDLYLGQVADNLIKKCTGGYTLTKKKQIIKNGEVVQEEVEEVEQAPDTTALIFTLKAKAGWSDKGADLSIDINVNLLDQARNKLGMLHNEQSALCDSQSNQDVIELQSVKSLPDSSPDASDTDIDSMI